jgi:hypothetical protein
LKGCRFSWDEYPKKNWWRNFLKNLNSIRYVDLLYF